MSPIAIYLRKPPIMTSFSLLRHSRVSRLQRSQPCSHCDVIFIMTLLSWPRPALWTYITYVRIPYRV